MPLLPATPRVTARPLPATSMCLRQLALPARLARGSTAEPLSITCCAPGRSAVARGGQACVLHGPCTGGCSCQPPAARGAAGLGKSCLRLGCTPNGHSQVACTLGKATGRQIKVCCGTHGALTAYARAACWRLPHLRSVRSVNGRAGCRAQRGSSSPCALSAMHDNLQASWATALQGSSGMPALEGMLQRPAAGRACTQAACWAVLAASCSWRVTPL